MLHDHKKKKKVTSQTKSKENVHSAKAFLIEHVKLSVVFETFKKKKESYFMIIKGVSWSWIKYKYQLIVILICGLTGQQSNDYLVLLGSDFYKEKKLK